jgi:hypothetical protein
MGCRNSIVAPHSAELLERHVKLFTLRSRHTRIAVDDVDHFDQRYRAASENDAASAR